MNDTLFSLSGHTAMVTGASSGLGRTFASVLAAAGASVVLTGRRMELLEQACAEITSQGGEAMAVNMDVTDEKTITQSFDEAERNCGCIDILVNNSGIAHGESALEIASSDWDRVIDTNLRGAWRVARESGERLVKAGKPGSIINIASVTSHLPLSKVIAYSASKAAVLSATRFLAREWAAKGVRVNSITPGFFPAEQNKKLLFNEDGTPSDRALAIYGHTPMGRFGDPSELAGAAVYLASEKAASFVTGSDIVVDGGFLSQTI